MEALENTYSSSNGGIPVEKVSLICAVVVVSVSCLMGQGKVSGFPLSLSVCCISSIKCPGIYFFAARKNVSTCKLYHPLHLQHMYMHTMSVTYIMFLKN